MVLGKGDSIWKRKNKYCCFLRSTSITIHSSTYLYFNGLLSKCYVAYLDVFFFFQYIMSKSRLILNCEMEKKSYFCLTSFPKWLWYWALWWKRHWMWYARRTKYTVGPQNWRNQCCEWLLILFPLLSDSEESYKNTLKDSLDNFNK